MTLLVILFCQVGKWLLFGPIGCFQPNAHWGERMAPNSVGLTRKEMTSALKRKGQRIVPVKWDDFSDRYMNTNKERLLHLYEKWGKDYVQANPWYQSKPVGEEALKSEFGAVARRSTAWVLARVLRLFGRVALHLEDHGC